MNEAEIQQLIQIEGPKYSCFLMRNNSGALKDATGRLVRYGLGNVSKIHNDRIKSSDLIGFTNIGADLPIFTAIECKAPGWIFNPDDPREKAQLAFINWILKFGGFAGFAQSVDDFRRIIKV